MSDIHIATATNGFVVTEKNLAIGQLSRTWVFTTPQELATFIAAHFEPADQAPENQRIADALERISGVSRKVIHPISVKVTDQDGSFGFVKWDLEIKECPAGAREKTGDALIGVRPDLYRQEVSVPAQCGNVESMDWAHEINDRLAKADEETLSPMLDGMYEIINRSRQLVGKAGFEPFLADHLANVASPEPDLSDITASVIKRQGL